MAKYLTLEARAAKRRVMIAAQATRLRAWKKKRMLPRAGNSDKRRSLVRYNDADLASLAKELDAIKQAGVAKQTAVAEARNEARQLTQ